MFRLRGNAARVFENIDAALEFAEAEDLDCVVVDRYGDYVARRRYGGRVEFPAGVFSALESAQLALLRRSR